MVANTCKAARIGAAAFLLVALGFSATSFAQQNEVELSAPMTAVRGEPEPVEDGSGQVSPGETDRTGDFATDPDETSTDRAQAAAIAALAPFLGLVVGIIGFFGVIVGAIFGRLNAMAANNQRSSEIEIGQLQAKLNGFYGPFQLISQENHIIAREFKARHGGGEFRTLVALLDPSWRKGLSAADRTIVAAMIENGKVLRALIREKAGLVDPQIQPYLAEVSAHFAVLEMAYLEGLENDPERFRQYVYPQELDTVLRLEFERLSERIDFLFQRSGRKNKPMAPLDVEKALSRVSGKR